MKKFFLAGLGFLGSSACVTRSHEQNFEPLVLVISVGHPWVGQHLLQWESNRLTLRKSGVDQEALLEKTFRPSAREWQQFWAKMDSLKVWKWRSYYKPGEPEGQRIETDGPVWKVSLETSDAKRVYALGNSIFPPDEKLMGESASYQEFCNAVKALISEDFCG